MNNMKSYNRNIKVIPYCPNKHYTYPNQKTSRYYIDKLVDITLAIVTGIGACTAFFFLIML